MIDSRWNWRSPNGSRTSQLSPLGKQRSSQADKGSHSIEWYLENVYEIAHWYPTLARPLSSFPSDDPEGWQQPFECSGDKKADCFYQYQIGSPSKSKSRLREKDDAQRRAQAAERAAAERQRQRAAALNPYYNKRRNQQSDNELAALPRFEPFKSFKSVKPFWMEDGATVDAGSWKEALDTIKQEVKLYRTYTRIKAITVILAANNDVPLSSLSTDPADYPEDAFFNKPTSHFYSIRGGVHLPSCLSRSRIVAFHAILTAAGLDPDTTAIEDVLALGRTLLWPECSDPAQAASKWTPLELVSLFTAQISRRITLLTRFLF
jgi:hypothetical protein